MQLACYFSVIMLLFCSVNAYILKRSLISAYLLARASSTSIPSTVDKIHYTLTKNTLYEEEIKKSKFIVSCCQAGSYEEAMEVLKSVRDDRASHNCWAFRSFNSERSSDDGEPSGTAGRPILQALEYESIVDCIVIVTRFFGGIKLGAGGLMRSYGHVAREALRQSERIPVTPKVNMIIRVNMEELGQVYQCLQLFPSASRRREEFLTDLVEFEVSCPDSDHASFSASLLDLCRGKATVELLRQ